MKQKGFTLLEVLIVVLVSSIAGVLLIQSFVQNNSVLYQQSARVNEGLNLNEANAQITQDIKTAAAVAQNYPAASPFQYTSSSNTLILKIPSIDLSGSIIDQTFDYIVIATDSAKPYYLRRQVFVTTPSTRGASNKILVNNISKALFYYYDNSGNTTLPTQATKINFVLNDFSQLGTKQQTSSSSGEVILRND